MLDPNLLKEQNRGSTPKLVPSKGDAEGFACRDRGTDGASAFGPLHRLQFFVPRWIFFLSNNMHLIQYATEADGPALAKVNVESFRARLLLGQVFPGSNNTLLREYKTHVGMKHLANPNMHVLKIHSENGELVTYSRWQLPASFGQSQVPLSDQGALSAKDPLVYAPQPMNTEAFAAFKKILEEGRKKHTTEDDIGKFLALGIPGQPRIGTLLTLQFWICWPLCLIIRARGMARPF